MIERAFAVGIVEAELAREYAADPTSGDGAGPRWVLDVRRHELGWLVAVASEDGVPHPGPRPSFITTCPYLVDDLDGSLHRVIAAPGHWEADYRAVVRGERDPKPLDELAADIRAVAAEHGRLPALRKLRRRVPTLDIAGARTYLDALVADTAPPAALLALAMRALPSPLDFICELGHERITGPNRPPT
ncbi:hypothetical protein [Streptomyces sp. SID3343]|uniref:hypothetical protein n=1 Tax=Streptomyces sp. SID3343 TaxID=2690260 RepID=UPI001368B55A|nr:hypothetical protein [Streptomyces sp. SID3343]MYV98937.1 hypothetical protein [Streptomyces sp. SID3343]